MNADALYTYRCRISGFNPEKIYDADTARLDIDLGLNTWIMNEPVRLHGINAPELRGEERQAGLAARDWLRDRLMPHCENPEAHPMIVETVKDEKGKYGRWLGVLWLFDPRAGKYINLNEALVEAGHAKVANY